MTSEYFTLRVLALLVLVAGVNLWLDHHLGLRLANSSVVSMVVAAVAGGLALLEKVLSKGEQDSLRARAGEIVRVVFWPPLLVVAWVVALVLALTLSSVTVVPEAGTGKFDALLTPGAEAHPLACDTCTRTSKEGGAVHFLVPTSPFGRPMRLSVAGYVPAILDVYPFAGRRVVLGTEMRPSPSVLLRLPVSAHALLGEGTRLVVHRLVGDRKALVADVATKTNRSSFLLGRRREVPATLRRNWENELEADGLNRSRPETAAQQAMMLKEWRTPLGLPTDVPLEPDMTLVAELLASGEPAATATLTLSPEPFQEMALRKAGE
jgi:hypothetical protein